MSSRGLGIPIVALGLLACTAQRAAAQVDTSYENVWDHPSHASAFLGESFPTARWRNNFETGDDGAASVAYPVWPGSGIWVEGAFNGQSQFMRDATRSAYGAVGAGASIYSFTLNAVFHAKDILFGRVSPYVLGGGGWYQRAIELDNYAGNATCSAFIGFCGIYGSPANRSRTQNVGGWDAGGGVRVRVPGIWVFAEARYNAAHTRYAPTTFVPIVVGLSW
jgi:hypothetical protein